MNEDIMRAMNFEKEVDRAKAGKCPFCDAVINMNDFKDVLSVKEYGISGLCQRCQNKVFGTY